MPPLSLGAALRVLSLIARLPISDRKSRRTMTRILRGERTRRCAGGSHGDRPSTTADSAPPSQPRLRARRCGPRAVLPLRLTSALRVAAPAFAVAGGVRLVRAKTAGHRVRVLAVRGQPSLAVGAGGCAG